MIVTQMLDREDIMKRKHTSADVSQLVDDILQEAVSRRASDIHFEPTSRKLLVKFRLDGQLKIVDELPTTASGKVQKHLLSAMR